MPRLLASDDLTAQLAGLPAWRLEDTKLVRTVELADFAAALALVVAIGDEAEAMNHHPDIDLRHNRVRLAQGQEWRQRARVRGVSRVEWRQRRGCASRP